jgi:hypothetical protein
MLIACVSKEKSAFPITQSVGVDGAHIEGQGITLDIPAGALDSTHDLSIDVANYTPAANTTPLGPTFHFEPSGLTFAKPVTLTLDIPPDTDAVVLWSRPDDEHSFEVVGFSAGGKAVAENTHFSDGTAVAADDSAVGEACGESALPDGCGCGADAEGSADEAGIDGGSDEGTEVGLDDAATDAGTCSVPSRDLCRQVCICEADDTTNLSNSEECAFNPANDTGICPAPVDPTTPAGADGHEYLADGSPGHPNTNGSACEGWAWVPTILYLCDCYDETVPTGPTTTSPNYLCPIAETKNTLSGTPVCDSTIEYPPGYPGGTLPHKPDPSECPSGTSDRTKCDFHLGAFATETWNPDPKAPHVSCTGYDYYSGSKPLTGYLTKCSPTPIVYAWKKLPGKSRDCRDIPADTDGLPAVSADDLMRCRLSKQEWSDLQSARKDCGTPVRTPDSKNPDAKKGTPVFAILTISDGAGAILRRIVGASPNARVVRSEIEEDAGPVGKCPPYDGSPLSVSATASLHAETDALFQLANLRINESSGLPTLDCAEMTVDRPACGFCEFKNIEKGRKAAGVKKLIVRNPELCKVYADGLNLDENGNSKGLPCDTPDNDVTFGHCK